MPRQFSAMVRAELLKVFTQWSGLGAVCVSVLIGIFTVLWLDWVAGLGDGAQMNGQAWTNFLQTDAVGASGYALFVRNFFVLPMLLFLATASSVAGERANGTLRELVVRPVPRWSILAAKTVALWALSIFTLVGTFLASILLGWAIFAEPAAGAAAGSVVRVFLGYAASFVSDVALIALGLALATFMRSVGGVVVSLLLLLMVDRFVWVMLYGLGQFLGQGWTAAAMDWTLVGAMGCWESWETQFEPIQFVAVVAITAIASAIALIRFRYADVP